MVGAAKTGGQFCSQDCATRRRPLGIEQLEIEETLTGGKGGGPYAALGVWVTKEQEVLAYMWSIGVPFFVPQPKCSLPRLTTLRRQ